MLLKIEKLQLQKEMGTLKPNNNMLKSTVEVLSGELEEVKTAYNYIRKNSIHKDSQFLNCISDISSSKARNEEFTG